MRRWCAWDSNPGLQDGRRSYCGHLRLAYLGIAYETRGLELTPDISELYLGIECLLKVNCRKGKNGHVANLKNIIRS